MNIKTFTFNPFAENTYVLFDESKKCIIVDPGCSNHAENNQLFEFIAAEDITPLGIYNTHNHIDHVLGVSAIRDKYKIPFYCNQLELESLRRLPDYAPSFGMVVSPIQEPEGLIDAESKIKFGNTELSCLFTPGHSAGSLCFLHSPSNQLIGGDVLFNGSIGRTDLPGGDYKTLMESIQNQLLALQDLVVVYPGHGPTTTIGKERLSNPFILDYLASL